MKKNTSLLKKLNSDKNIYYCYYSFFETIIKMEFETTEDFEDFNFFYSENYIPLDSALKEDITIRIKSTRGEATIKRLIDNPSLDYASYKIGNQKVMKKWKEKSTIIPPFKLPPMKGNFVLFHGTILIKNDCDIANNSSTLVMAEHYQGKTSITLSLINSGKFKYLSEDLIPYNFKQKLVYPINKPGGIRYKTIPLIKGLKSKLQQVKNKKEYISLVTGNITVVKLNELFKNSYHSKPTNIDKVIFLSNKGEDSKKPTFTKLSKKEIFLNLLKHRFNVGLPIATELRECLLLAREIEGYELTYNLHRDLSKIPKLLYK